MRKTIVAIAAVTALALPTLASAAQGRPGGYFSGFLGFNQTKDATMETTDFVAGSTFEDRLEFDPGIYIGGTGGYDFGIVRLEGELSYRNAEINQVNADRGIDSNLGIVAMMFNTFVDLENDTPVTPYLGAGVGFASLSFDDDHYDRSTGDPVFYEDDASTYAYQLGAGLEFSITRRFSLDLGYRFFKTGTAEFDSNWDLENDLKVESHNVALGFRAKF